MASLGQTISSDALRAFRLYHFVRVWGKEVFLLLYKHLFLSGQPKTIREILEESGIPFPPNISARKCHFNDQEIRNLSGRPEDLDITLMNKVCRALWNKGLSDPGDTLTDLMKKIKDERNIVCHEEGCITQTELEHKVNAFQTTLEQTLDEAKSLGPQNSVHIDQQKIDQLKSEICHAVPNLLEKIREKYDPSKQDEFYKLQDEIKDFWSQFYEYILQLIQDELKPLYERLCKICFYEWLVQYGVSDPCGTTVSLKMDQEKEFHGCQKGQGCITVDQNEILSIKDPNGKDPKAIIISGCAGAGKSTIMCCTLEKWHKDTRDMPNLSSFQILLYLPFRNHCDDNFDDYLQSLLPKTLGLFAIEHVKSAIMSSKCLILCDGYDEANGSSRKLFEELITLNFKDRKVVVTTRPGGTEEVTNVIKRAKHDRINLSVLGLRGEDMKPLLKKITAYLIKDDVTRVEMERELIQVVDEMNKTAKVILETPLYFNLLILLYIECPGIRERIRSEKIISASTLYILFEEHKKDRIIEKTRIQSEYLKKFDNMYLEYSMQNYKEKKYELSQKDVDDMKSQTQCKEVTDNFDSLLSSYFNIKHSIEGIRMKKAYCYRHASELEFAAARKISEDIIKSYGTKTGNIVERILISNGIWEHLRKSRDTENLFTFIVGILYKFKRNAFYSVIDDVHNSLLTLARDDFDLLLKPSMATCLDSKVLDSLALLLENTSRINKISIEKASSVFVLPQLLARLEPKFLEIKPDPSNISKKRDSIDFPSLKKTLEFSNKHNIPTHLFLPMDLRDTTELSGGASYTVDKLQILIEDIDEGVDLPKLCPFPFSSKDLSVWYGGPKRNILEVSSIINAVWPRSQDKELSETTNKGEISLSTLTSTWKNFASRIIKAVWPGREIKHLKLMIWKELKGKEADEGIRLLLKSLNVQPLTELCLPLCYVSNEEIQAELSSECRKRGFGELTVEIYDEDESTSDEEESDSDESEEDI